MDNDIILELNDKQAESVVSTEGYLRVIAGAGSGKTKLLVSRYAYLVKECGIDSANILCVTFTSKAAAEMKKRIRALIGDQYDTSLICTYHGFCVRVLREDIEKLFYPKGFQILDESLQKSIIEEIYQKYELKFDYASFSKTMQDIHKYKAKNKYEYVDKMNNREYVQILDTINSVDDKVIEDYLQREKNIFGLDFDDLMYFTIYLFNKFNEVLEKWKDKLNYIQVDEFQDSSNIEMELIDLISDNHKNLMIVGDPDQNIYEWRGSDVKLLVDFDKTHNPCKTILLTQNYRSTKAILKVANTLIDVNKYRIKKDLFTLNDSDIPVIHFHTKNENEEAEKIADKISYLVKNENVKYNQIAILYRSGYLSRIIEKKLAEKALPYEIFGGVKFYQRMEIRDILAYLRLIAFDDDISLKRIINTPRRQFGRVKLSNLINMQQNQSLYETLKENYYTLTGENKYIIYFINEIDEIKKNKNKKKISEIVEDVLNKTGYEKYIRELGDDERFDNLTEFKRIANEYEKNYGEDITLEDFINQISIQSEDNSDENTDLIKLMTIHSSKGLEFDNVFVIGFSEGIFPSSKTIELRKDMGLEEERRLCYVALTRARKRLFLTDSEGFNQNGKQKNPSRFLFEMGEDNYERIGIIPQELLNNTHSVMKNKVDIDSIELKKVGDIVEHKLYGKGVVEEVLKTRQSYKIKFYNCGSRYIQFAYFNNDNNGIKINTSNYDKNIKNGFNDNLHKVDLKVNNDKKHTSDNNENDNMFNYDELKTDNKQYASLWDDPSVPKSGWSCEGVIDLGKPLELCEMCGKQIIRYVHIMKHPNYRTLRVGCVCAGKMEGDIEKAKKREEDLKRENSRLDTFLRKEWKLSLKGNKYIKFNNHIIVLYYNPKKKKYNFSVDNVFDNEGYSTDNEAKIAAFYKCI